MKWWVYLVIFCSFGVKAEISLKLSRKLKLKSSDHDYVVPLDFNSYILKGKKSKNTTTVHFNKIKPISVKELESFIKYNTGSSKYEIVEVDNKPYYYFYSKDAIFYFEASGDFIQIRGRDLRREKISLGKI